jgi:virginiamycin B lyase
MKKIVKKILHYLSQRDFGEITFALTILLIIVSIIMLYGCNGSPIEPEPTPPTPPPTPTPTFVTYTGTGANPYAICADSSGNVWTANVTDNSVTKITQSGQMTTYPGTGEAPEKIVYDGSNLWTCNAMGNSVTKITQSGQMTTFTGTGEEPVGITFDGSNVWTCNLLGNSVTKVTQSGQMTTYPLKGIGKSPVDITFDGSNIWTVNNDSSATRISPDGEMTKFKLLPWGQINIVSDQNGNVWVENFGLHSVSKITNTGQMTSYDLGSPLLTPLGITYSKYSKCVFTINGTDNTTYCSITKVEDGNCTTWHGPWTNDHYAISADKFGNLWVTGSDKNGDNSVTKVTLPK